MTLHTDGRNRVSHQCELSNVNAADVNEKMTLNTDGRYRVYHQCELLNVNANELLGKRLCTLGAGMGFLTSVNS